MVAIPWLTAIRADLKTALDTKDWPRARRLTQELLEKLQEYIKKDNEYGQQDGSWKSKGETNGSI